MGEGHAVRVTTRGEPGRAAIETVGAECWIGTPERLSTLRAALESVTVVCWLLGTATGVEDEVRALHASRLEFFMGQVIDTTVRGFVYEAVGSVPRDALAAGEEIVRAVAQRNAIPVELLRADPEDRVLWLEDARGAIDALLAGR